MSFFSNKEYKKFLSVKKYREFFSKNNYKKIFEIFYKPEYEVLLQRYLQILDTLDQYARAQQKINKVETVATCSLLAL